jgi:hypothetical protein
VNTDPHPQLGAIHAPSHCHELHLTGRRDGRRRSLEDDEVTVALPARLQDYAAIGLGHLDDQAVEIAQGDPHLVGVRGPVLPTALHVAHQESHDSGRERVSSHVCAPRWMSGILGSRISAEHLPVICVATGEKPAPASGIVWPEIPCRDRQIWASASAGNHAILFEWRNLEVESSLTTS